MLDEFDITVLILHNVPQKLTKMLSSLKNTYFKNVL